jgi:hypothetical protein
MKRRAKLTLALLQASAFGLIFGVGSPLAAQALRDSYPKLVTAETRADAHLSDSYSSRRPQNQTVRVARPLGTMGCCTEPGL